MGNEWIQEYRTCIFGKGRLAAALTTKSVDNYSVHAPSHLLGTVDRINSSHQKAALHIKHRMVELPPIISISELNRLARGVLESEIPLIWVAGEISNLTRATSGHVYFSLKDESAQARCVMFRNRAQLVPWQLANGQQIEARTLVSIYEARGDYQLNIETLRRAGLGRLYEAFARLRQQLDAEGLFAELHKQAIPRLPKCVGIVTSLQAAALRDVLAAFARRGPHVPLIIFPTPVQGEAAGKSIADAIRAAIQHGTCDLLLVVRGGGSLEDLWSFNEEVVARAIFASPLPVIAGVGHETDITMADLVADTRAATPTAAAELATAGWFAAAGELVQLQATLQARIGDCINRNQQRLDDLQRRLIHPAAQLAKARVRLELLGTRLRAATLEPLHAARLDLLRSKAKLHRACPRLERYQNQLGIARGALRLATADLIAKQRVRLERAEAGLDHLNPEATLLRGYAIVFDENDHLMRDAQHLSINQRIHLQLARGVAYARVDQVVSDKTETFVAPKQIPD
jgi:exodeoxyribonuclease VII large subunit